MFPKVWDEKLETLSREALERIRLTKLRDQIQYCYKNTPFYGKKFKEMGITPEAISTWEDFRKLPILMTKEEERLSELESRERLGHTHGMHLGVPPEKMIIVRNTSGTTGNPTFSYSYTKADYERFKECLARVYWLASLRPGDRVLNCFPVLGGIHGSGGLWGGAMAHMNVIPLEVGAECGPEKTIQYSLLTKPNGLLASPSFAESLIETCPQISGKEIRELGIQKLLLTGEPGIEIPAIRKRVEGSFGGKWHVWWALYGEVCASSCELEEYQGMHEVAPDFCIHAEDLIDPITKNPLEITEGVIGEAVMTALGREGLTFFKYETGDVIQLFTRPCECGYPGPGYRFKMIGRVEDMLLIEGVRVFPLMVRQIINSFSPKLTGAMRIVLTEKPPKINSPLKIKLEYGSEIEKGQLVHLENEIKGKIREELGIISKIEFLPPTSLGKSIWKTSIFEKMFN